MSKEPTAAWPSSADSRTRLIDVAGMHNFRDVGGYLVGGGRTRWGQLFRAGTLDGISTSTHSQLAELGIRTVVDLREAVEFDDSVLLEAPSFAQLNNPIFRQRTFVDAAEDLGPLYLQILEQCAPEIVSAIDLVARPRALPALVHCSAGKDRTGLVIALILSAVGVADEVVSEDYGRTSEFLSEDLRAHIAAKGEKLGISAQRMVMLMGSPPHVMQAMLNTLRLRFGSTEGYLIAHGLRPEALVSLRDALIEHPTADCRDLGSAGALSRPDQHVR